MNAFNGETFWYNEQFLNHIIAESGIIITFIINEEDGNNITDGIYPTVQRYLLNLEHISTSTSHLAEFPGRSLLDSCRQ